MSNHIISGQRVAGVVKHGVGEWRFTSELLREHWDRPAASPLRRRRVITPSLWSTTIGRSLDASGMAPRTRCQPSVVGCNESFVGVGAVAEPAPRRAPPAGGTVAVIGWEIVESGRQDRGWRSDTVGIR
jgi:hypothetical protein